MPYLLYIFQVVFCDRLHIYICNFHLTACPMMKTGYCKQRLSPCRNTSNENIFQITSYLSQRIISFNDYSSLMIWLLKMTFNLTEIEECYHCLIVFANYNSSEIENYFFNYLVFGSMILHYLLLCTPSFV